MNPALIPLMLLLLDKELNTTKLSKFFPRMAAASNPPGGLGLFSLKISQ